MKSVGIIGGLGPETTSKFYLEVLYKCQKLNTVQRPLIVIGSVPLEFEIEHDAIARNVGIERCLPFLITEAKRLEQAGVDFLVMPCNSLHLFIEEIRSSVSIPILSIVEETAAYIEKNHLKKVGLISTSATVLNGVYEAIFASKGIEYITPEADQRARIDGIIQRLINGRHESDDRNYLIDTCHQLLEQGAEKVALACTDLQLLGPKSDRVVIFDTMQILADSTVHRILDHPQITHANEPRYKDLEVIN
jgi:aspartate racemase